MIKIEKRKAPDFLNSSKVDLAIEKMNEFFLAKNRGQKRYDWPFNKEINKELKKHLHKIFHGKCGYCESKIGSSYIGTIDRYRPNNGVREKNKFHQDLYWWLTFEWDNLIYCCRECNQYKGNYFPIRGQRIFSEIMDYKSEQPMLLNPYLDKPGNHFTIENNTGDIQPLTEKGLQTIELLRLNRTNLKEGRRKAWRDVIDAINSLDNQFNNYEIKKHLRSIYEKDDKSIEFLFYKRQILLKELESNYSLANLLNNKYYLKDQVQNQYFVKPAKKQISKKGILVSDYFPIEYIHIKNFKSIDDLRIDFKEDELNKKSWLFLLGENGAGKSSILQAIAIGLTSDTKFINEDIIKSLIKKGKHTSTITLKERNSNNIIHTKLVRKTGEVNRSGQFNSYLIGYGSLRLSIDETKNIHVKKDTSKVSYENLFKPIMALNNVTKWLKSINKKNPDFFDSIAYSIKELLPHDKPDTELAISGGEIVLGNSKALFTELSDGYKSTITLAIDIMMKLSDAQSDMKVMSGIVLIDELGNQLHPRWQMRIVRQLRKVFPNINFIVSTHHPLCLRGAEEKEILLLRNLEGQVVATKELPNPASLRVDQILASEFFGLSSLVDPEIEARFNRYYELLAKNNKITSNEQIERDRLKDFLRNKKQLGSSLREELMYTVIDKLLAEKVAFNREPFNRDSLKKEAVQRVQEVWNNLNLGTDD